MAPAQKKQNVPEAHFVFLGWGLLFVDNFLSAGAARTKTRAAAQNFSRSSSGQLHTDGTTSTATNATTTKVIAL